MLYHHKCFTFDRVLVALDKTAQFLLSSLLIKLRIIFNDLHYTIPAVDSCVVLENIENQVQLFSRLRTRDRKLFK